MSYSAIGNTEIDADSPITAALMQRLRDNPLAVAAGVAGAPKINGGALNTHLGAQVLTDSVGPLLILSVGGVACIAGGFQVSNAVGSSLLRAQYSADNGATWGAVQTLVQLGAAAREGGLLRLNLQSGTWFCSGFDAATFSGTHTVPPNCNAVWLSLSAKASSAPLTVWGFDPFILSGVV